MSTYIVVDIANADTAEAAREAIGRLYAESLDKAWPVPACFPSGARDPDILHSTFYYWDPRANGDATKVAFGPAGDETEEALMAFCLGKTVVTTYGAVILPSATEDLEDEWFAE
jgi:hypothetical protein